MRTLIASLICVVASCAAMERRRADITLRPVPPGSQKGTRMESLRRRRAVEAKPRPRMVRAYIRALVAKTVTGQLLATAAIKVGLGADAYSAARGICARIVSSQFVSYWVAAASFAALGQG